MDWLQVAAEVLVLAALLLGLASLAETFRAEPIWLRAGTDRPGQSPRQRRWHSIGISSMMAGMLLTFSLEGDTWLWAPAFALVGCGAACTLASIFVQPTEHEERRHEQLQGGERGSSTA